MGRTPLDGFFPLVGIGLSDEFTRDDLLGTFPVASSGVGGDLLGAGGTPNYDLALLDTGAAISLITSQAFDDFGLGEPGQGGGSDGYRGALTIPIGGATGQLDVPINDPLGLYAGGLQDRTGAGASLTLNPALLEGQTNTATVTFPPTSELPNVVGLPFASQYATHIHADQPQVFQLGGRTVRTPAIDFRPLGSGGGDIVRRAPLTLGPGSSFINPPGYIPNILNIVDSRPVHEDPQTPTVQQGGLFLNVTAENGRADLGGTQSFFFDTGASVTVLSQLSALSLGFDALVDEPEFTISILGSGGAINDVPGFFVDEITLTALGGNVTATNVPVIVLDVTDPSDPGNVVPGIVGTNLLAGRNVVIDPNPSLGAGGNSAGVYISDPVTTDFVWNSTAPAGLWDAHSSWDTNATPDLLSVTRVQTIGVNDQEAVVTGAQQASTLEVFGGASGQTTTVRISAGASLTTFSGTTVEAGGVIALNEGVLDTQFLDLRGGRLTGEGLVTTGSGPIVGQVESIDGSVAPGDGVGTLTIDGRLSLAGESTLEIELAGLAAGTEHDQLVVEGPAALSGLLAVSLDEGAFSPEAGDTFLILTHDQGAGQFDATLLPDGYFWDVRYRPDGVTLEVLGLGIEGDFNHDGSVDMADYTVWRDNLDSYYTPGDYAVWLANFGSSTPIPASAAAVPEPDTTVALLLSVVVYVVFFRPAPHAAQ